MNNKLRISNYAKQIVVPEKNSHKGENGRVLVIGGSRLFHAASFWSASMASKIVDMVHFSSPAMENNELMRIQAKSKFWEGIVVPWEEVSHYIEEDDALLIGPGMVRASTLYQVSSIKYHAREQNTRDIVNSLLRKYPEKRWVVDGGALQEVDPKLLNQNMIVTPNKRELGVLMGKTSIKYQVSSITRDTSYMIQAMGELASKLGGVTVLAKGLTDLVCGWEPGYHAAKRHQPGCVEIVGGSVGMTKGGTGDVLAGLVTALYAKSPAMAACVVASRVNKLAGEQLEKRVGPFFGAGELIPEVQRVLAGVTMHL